MAHIPSGRETPSTSHVLHTHEHTLQENPFTGVTGVNKRFVYARSHVFGAKLSILIS